MSSLQTPPPPTREPIFNAPLVPLLLAGGLIVLHGAFILLGEPAAEMLLYRLALIPERSGAPVGADFAYESALMAFLPLVGHGFLHADWMHVLVNAGFLLAFGAPLTRIMGGARFMVIYIAALIGGGVAYLLLNAPGLDGGSIAIGASGGVSGLMGALFLWLRGGGLFNRNFLLMTGIFMLGNIAIAIVGPALLGGGIAWEAHVGGYAAGVIVGRLIWSQMSGRDATSPD